MTNPIPHTMLPSAKAQTAKPRQHAHRHAPNTTSNLLGSRRIVPAILDADHPSRAMEPNRAQAECVAELPAVCHRRARLRRPGLEIGHVSELTVFRRGLIEVAPSA